MVKKIIYRSLFFIGWVLSPFTSWNDAFVNIPLSYICANMAIRFTRMNFLTLVLIFYWLTNILGMAIMYLAGKNILTAKKGVVREMWKLVITMALYSIVLIVLHRVGVLKPL